MSAREKYEYHLANWSDIQNHLPRLHEAARGVCLEIGVRAGVSTSALLSGIEEHGGHLYSLDINDCPVFAGHPQWTFIQGDSAKAKLDMEFEVAFIDGDHTHKGALCDLLKFGTRSKLIFVHDTDAPDYPGVKTAVEEFCKASQRKVTYHPGSFGMAEIR